MSSFYNSSKEKTLRKDLSKNSIYIKIKAIANIIIHTFKFIAKQSNLKSKRFLKLITNYLNLKDQNGLLLAFLVNVFYSKCTVSKIKKDIDHLIVKKSYNHTVK